MDILKCIKADHDEAADLFAELSRIAHDDRRTSDAMRTAVRLACTLKIHQHAEQKVVYALLRSGDSRLAELSRQGGYEHQTLDLLLDRLLLQRPGAEMFAILKVAHHHFEHHARVEEEGELLPLLGRALSTEERVHLGHDFLHERRRVRPAVERLVGPAARPVVDPRHFHISHHRR